MSGYSNFGKGDLDLEAGGLYPGISSGENELRWGFIQKVYGILTAQILLTTVVSSITVLNAPINNLLRGSPGLLFLFAILPLICKDSRIGAHFASISFNSASRSCYHNLILLLVLLNHNLIILLVLLIHNFLLFHGSAPYFPLSLCF